MSTDDPTARARLHAATWFRAGTQHPVERDVLDLLDEVERLTRQRDEANARADATRQMAIDANTALRDVLLSALGRDNDGHTSLHGYVYDLITEREEARAEVDRLRTEMAAELAAKFRGVASRCDHDPKLQRCYEMAARIVEEHVSTGDGTDSDG